MPKLTIHKLGEAIVFRCTGRIGFGECHILRHAVFSHPHIATAVLDMAEVTAIDASGLGLLLELRNWASTNRIQLKLLNLTPRVANLLDVTHLTPIFDVCSVGEHIFGTEPLACLDGADYSFFDAKYGLSEATADPGTAQHLEWMNTVYNKSPGAATVNAKLLLTAESTFATFLPSP